MSLRFLIIPLALFITGCDRAPDPTSQPDPETPPRDKPVDSPVDPPEKGPAKSKSPSIASQLDHQWQAVELWEGDSKSPDDVLSSTMVEFREGKFKYLVDGETNLEADYQIVAANTDPARLQLSFDADGTTQTINVLFKISDDQLTFAHPISSSDPGWPEALEKGANVAYAVFQRK